MFSTVPGFDNPRAALRSEKEVYVSAKATVIALLYRKPKGVSFSKDIDISIGLEQAINGARRSSSGGETIKGYEAGGRSRGL